MNRRDFLGTTGVALAATAWMPLPPLAAQDAPAKKRTIRKAIMYATIGVKGTVLEKMQAVKAAGFEGIEPMSHMNQNEVMAALEATGLKAASVCCSTHWNDTLTHADPA